jgi:uncharacterized Fe-S cluster protein YjdI
MKSVLIGIIVAIGVIGAVGLFGLGGAWAEMAVWDYPTTYEDGTPIASGDLVGYNLYETTGGVRVKVNSSIISHSSNCTGTTSPKCSWIMPSQTKGDTFVMVAVDALGQESKDSNVATFMGKKLSVPFNVMIK